MDFQCGYCTGISDCSISQECTDSQAVTDGQQCPPHMIGEFSPTSGPPSGGTVITITGTNLGVTFDDFGPDSITVGGVPCTPCSDGYEPGRRISCQISGSLGDVGPKPVVVTLTRVVGGEVSVPAMEEFMVVRPTLSSVEPGFGPIAGSSMLRIRGTGLDIGNDDSVTVTLDAAGMCRVM